MSFTNTINSNNSDHSNQLPVERIKDMAQPSKSNQTEIDKNQKFSHKEQSIGELEIDKPTLTKVLKITLSDKQGIKASLRAMGYYIACGMTYPH